MGDFLMVFVRGLELTMNQNAIAFLANKETYKEIMSAIYTSKNCEIFIYNSNFHYGDVDCHIEWLIKARN